MKLCTVGKHRRTPWITIIIVGISAVVFTLIRNIQDVAEFTNFATLLAFIGVNASAVKIFAREHAESRFKHITQDIVLPLIGCIASAWLAIGLGWRAAVFGVSLLVIGLVIYYLLRRFSPDTGP